MLFQSNRWHRIRIHFDVAGGTWDTALVGVHYRDHYYGGKGPHGPGVFPHPTADWLPIGDNLPLRGERNFISRVVVKAPSGSVLLMDNLYVIGPWEGSAVNGKDYRRPARELIGTEEHPRHDPLRLKIYSTRNIQREEVLSFPHGKESPAFLPKYPAIMEAAGLYNEIMVRLAFLDERRRRINRALQYIDSAGERSRRLKAGALEDRLEELERRFGKAHILYAQAYLDGFNQHGMRSYFIPVAENLLDELEVLEDEFSGWFKEHGTGESPLDINLPAENPQYSKTKAAFVREDGGRAFIFYPRQYRGSPRQGELMGFDNIKNVLAHYPLVGTEEGEWFNPEYAGRARIEPDDSLFLWLYVGLHRIRSYAPLWWIEQHLDEPDVFFHDEEGNPTLHDAGGKEIPYSVEYHGASAQFNFWNPKVRDMFRKMLPALAEGWEKEFPGRISMIEIMPEADPHLGRFSTGYNESAISEFRGKMAGSYGTICNLNSIWGTRYSGFGDINPPPDIMRASRRGRPSALAYEWELFRQEGYRDWMKLVTDAIRAVLPDVPIVTRGMGYAGGGTSLERGFIMPLFYPLVDFAEYHRRGIGNRIDSRVLNSLQMALGGGGGTMGESYIGCTGEPGAFNQAWARSKGSFYIFDLAAFGRSVISIWGAGGGYGWTQTTPWTEPRLGHSVLTYGGGALHAVITRRLRAFERYLLDVPMKPAKINILFSDASFLQDCQVYQNIARVARILETEGRDYGYLWESLLLGDKQTLDDSRIIILPAACCLPLEMQERLLEWVKGGGTLFAVGPTIPGRYDELGRGSGYLMDGLRAPIEEGDARTTLMRSGRFVYIANIGDAQSRARFVRIIKERSSRFISSDGDYFLFTVRKRCETDPGYVITVSNTDMLQSATGEIRLEVPGAEVRDVELPGLRIPVRSENGHTIFNLRLEPYENVVLLAKISRN